MHTDTTYSTAMVGLVALRQIISDVRATVQRPDFTEREAELILATVEAMAERTLRKRGADE